MAAWCRDAFGLPAVLGNDADLSAFTYRPLDVTDGAAVTALAASLPALDVLSAEVSDPAGIGMLLPAVQKVRDAAAR